MTHLHCRKGTTVSENDSRMLIHLINVVYVHVLVHLLQRNRTQHFVNIHVFVCQTTGRVQHISQESVTTLKSRALSCLKEDVYKTCQGYGITLCEEHLIQQV